MNIVDIFICTCPRDLAYFEQCIRSIAKFATGFRKVVVRSPMESGGPAAFICRKHLKPDQWDVHSEPDRTGKGMVEHMAAVCRSDIYCHGATHVLHMDSDCIFTAAVTPDDYFVDGKPVLMYASYDWLKLQGDDLSHWMLAVESAIGGTCEHEFMRRHPAVHCVEVYNATRNAIEDFHRRSYKDYILSTKEDFPWTFTEFVTLGEIAWRKFRDRYHWINQETDPFPPHKLLQFWSHKAIDLMQDVNNGGLKMQCVPLEVCRKILG